MTSHSAVESAADARAGERKVAILSLSRASWRGDFSLLTLHATGSLEAVGPGAARAGPKEGPGGPRKEAAQKSKGQRRPENRQRTEAGMGKSTRKGRRRAGHRH